MLTNNIQDINNAISKAHKYASVVYNMMQIQKYGVKPCKACGDDDKIGKYNIHVIEYEMLKLSELSDGDCSQNKKCSCNNSPKCQSCGPDESCCYNLVSYEEIDEMIKR